MTDKTMLMQYEDRKIRVSNDPDTQRLKIETLDNGNVTSSETVWTSELPESVQYLTAYLLSVLNYGMELSEKQVAKLFGCSVSRIRIWKDTGELKSYKVGKSRVFNLKDVLDFYNTAEFGCIQGPLDVPYEETFTHTEDIKGKKIHKHPFYGKES